MTELIVTYGSAFVVFVATWAVLWGVKKFVIAYLTKLSKKTTTDLDDQLVGILDTVHPFVLGVLALAFAARFAPVAGIALQTVNAAFLVALVYQVSLSAARVVDIAVAKAKGNKGDAAKKAAMSFLSGSVKVAIWLIGGLLILSNLGINITSLIAGLGIGGVAIAFALQNILGDLFSSFAIYFDKPFEIGDMIVVGEYRGTVEKIGIKSTRIRSLQGEEIVIANQDLTSARIQNFRKLKERRVTFSFGAVYETPLEKVERIPEMVENIFSTLKEARFERVHFKTLGASSLDFEVVYFVTTDNYKKYMDIQQSINVALMHTFKKEGIEFAYPTQTLYVKK